MKAYRINTVDFTLSRGSTITEINVERVGPDVIWYNERKVEFEPKVTAESHWFEDRVEAVKWLNQEAELKIQNLYNQIQSYVDVMNRFIGE